MGVSGLRRGEGFLYRPGLIPGHSDNKPGAGVRHRVFARYSLPDLDGVSEIWGKLLWHFFLFRIGAHRNFTDCGFCRAGMVEE